MPTEFETSQESFEELRNLLLAKFPESTAELYLFRLGGKAASRAGKVSEMLDVLCQYCVQFPKALLRLNTDHPYGVAVTLWCHCTIGTGCETKCLHEQHRPKAMLAISVPVVGNKLGPVLQARVSALAAKEMKLPEPTEDRQH